MVSVSHITNFGKNICLSFDVALVAGAIYSGYKTVGAYHFGQFAFTNGNIAFFENIKIWINSPKQLSTLESVWFVLGGAIMVGLIALRY